MPSVWRTTSRRFSNPHRRTTCARSPLPSAMRRKPSRGLLWCCSNKRNGPTWWPGRSGWTRDPLTPRRPCPAPIYRHPPHLTRPRSRRRRGRTVVGIRHGSGSSRTGRRGVRAGSSGPRRSVPGRPGRRARAGARETSPPDPGCTHRATAAPGTGAGQPHVRQPHVQQPRTRPARRADNVRMPPS
jgi:hypothetical protein